MAEGLSWSVEPTDLKLYREPDLTDLIFRFFFICFNFPKFNVELILNLNKGPILKFVGLKVET